MEGEDVFGNKITVSDPLRVEDCSFQSGRNRKIQAKDDIETCQRASRKGREAKEDNFQFNNIYPQKQYLSSMETNYSHSQNLEPSFQQQLSKTMVPFFSNNISNFTFPKVPNIENFNVIRNPTVGSQKSYLNNLESHSVALETDSELKKPSFENKKFNNLLADQMEGLNFRCVSKK